MSDQDKKVESDQPEDASVKDFVSKKAYEEVTTDMHKFKANLKAEKAKAAEYEAKLQALEEERMRENDQWKELAEKYKAEVSEVRQEAVQVRQDFNNNTKKQALKAELGLSNDKYLVHANIESIEVNEYGVIDRDSLLSVANSFREEHGVLLQSPAGANPTSVPASSSKPQQQSLEDLSTKAKQELLRSLKQS